jgi:hypothetical protein
MPPRFETEGLPAFSPRIMPTMLSSVLSKRRWFGSRTCILFRSPLLFTCFVILTDPILVRLTSLVKGMMLIWSRECQNHELRNRQ